MLFVVILAVLQFFWSMQAAISRVEKKNKLKASPTLFFKILDVKLEIFFNQPYGDDGDTRTTKFVKA